MPGKNNTVDELCAMKARYVGEKQLEDPPEGKAKHANYLLTPAYWRILAALLALFCGTFLALSYIEISRIKQRATELKMLEDRMMGGEQRLIDISAEIGKMNAQRDSLLGQILKLETDAARNAESSAERRLLEKTLPPLKEEYTQLLSKSSELHENKSSLEQSIIIAQAKFAELQAVYSSQRESMKLLEKELKDKRSALIDVEKSIAEKQAAVTGASRSITDYKEQLTSVKDDYEKHKKDVAGLQTEKATLKKSIVEQETAMLSLREAQIQAKGRLDGLSAELTRLTEQIAADRKQTADLEKRKRSLTDEVAALQIERLQLDGLSEKIKAAKKELVVVEAQLGAKNIKLDELNQKAVQEEARIVDRQATIGELEGKIGELATRRIELSNYKEQLISVKDDYEKHKKDVAEIQTEKATVKKSIAEQETALVSLHEAQIQAKGRLDGLSAELTRLTEQIAADRKQTTDLEKRKRSLTDEVAALQVERLQLDGLSEKIKAVKKELVAVEAQLGAKNIKLDELNQKAVQEEARIVDRQATIEKLEGTIGELETWRLELTKDISRMQGQYEILKQQTITGKTDQPR